MSDTVPQQIRGVLMGFTPEQPLLLLPALYDYIKRMPELEDVIDRAKAVEITVGRRQGRTQTLEALKAIKAHIDGN